MLKPLAGIRVLDLGRTFAAPWCTQILGDLGAEIIKIERLGRGDEMRHYGPPFLQDADGNDLQNSAYFLCANRNKKSIALDLAKPGAQQIVRDLAAVSNVCIENFKVGDLARHQLDYASLARVNPQLIYCSVTGFGQDGPYAARPATDSVFQSMSGLMSVTGEADGDPQKVGLVITDLLTGLYCAIAIQAAIRDQEINGGAGQHIDMALLDVTVAAMSHRAMEYLMTGVVPQRMGSRAPGSAPAQVFHCADGRINLQASADRSFRKLCAIIDRADLPADARFNSRGERVRNIDVLVPILEAEFARWKTQDLYEALVEQGIVCSPIYSLDQTFEDPQVRHRGLQREIHLASGHDVPLIANPIRFSRTQIDYAPPPELGEHADELLSGLLGYDAARLAALRSEGALG